MIVYVKSHLEQWLRRRYIHHRQRIRSMEDGINSGNEIEYPNGKVFDDFSGDHPVMFLRLKPKANVSEIHVAKLEPKDDFEKYNTGNYIFIYKQFAKWEKSNDVEFWDEQHKLIHKRHEDVLNAYLEDNSVEIEFWHRLQKWSSVGADWLVIYKESDEYRLKPKQQEKPKTKIVKEWLCYNNGYYTEVSEFEPLFAIQVLKEIEVPNV